uniref:Fibronectin, type III-like fold n=1 Tax=Solanum tuberosum TaxID=4113 RepID=M1CTQ1_SOLTU
MYSSNNPTKIANPVNYVRVQLGIKEKKWRKANGVSADIILNRGVSEWWSFHDIDSLDVKGFGGLRGPMTITVSEETPRK